MAKKTQEEKRSVRKRVTVGGGGPRPTAGSTASHLPVLAGQRAVPSGAILGGGTPTGLFSATQAMEADVSGEMASLAPTFGDVLLSIGMGVAQSQEALDNGLVETAKLLSQTDVTVVTDVIQELDDDGLPIPDHTELVQHDVALINFVNPTVHEWSHMALSMDLSVGEIDNETGFTFNRRQTSSRVASGGLLWGFVGFGLHSDRTNTTYRFGNTDQEMDWSRGQVRMDALLRPRDVRGFPTPADVTIGPQIYFSQGSVVETVTGGVVTARTLDLLITVRKADGSTNPSVVIELDTGQFGHSFDTTGDFDGSTANSDGQVRVSITRTIPNARFLRPTSQIVRATLGSLERQVEIRL